MMNVIANRYAEALFQIGKEEKINRYAVPRIK